MNFFQISLLDDSFESSSDESLNNDGELLHDQDTRFKKLEQLLNSDEANDKTRTRLVVSKVEMLLGVLQFSVKYSLPNLAVADLCTLFNNFLSKPILPDSRYKLDQLFFPGEDVKYHAVALNV